MRVDKEQPVHLLEDNRLNEADICELCFFPTSKCLIPITLLLYSKSLLLQPQ